MASSSSPQHKYENVQLDHDPDHDHDSRSSTEVESLIGDEKSWRAHQHERRSKRSKLACILRSSRWMLDTTLLLIIVALLVRNEMREEPAVHDQWQLLGDMTGVGPRFPQKLARFEYDTSYAPMNTSEFFTNETLAKWNNLMPKGMGFQWVNDTHKYHDLPKPIDWYEGMTVFTTSVTHQIHCLFAMAQTYSGLSSGHPIPDDHHWHMIHCIAYMRQAITCAADTALEGHATTFPDDNSGSDGWDATHVCKDYDQVLGYLESVRAYDDQLIY
ncbi:hypothetical protein KVR01_008065 [Diaporthe batatas]|uniref:uncharacterized protein n=1 Tax=Diaporthe batatas TaxID=748121 RepID=UPI001D0512C9|nr:uncharacterized protein KVR01_008065 [Diaporthe batatas]KAG8162300.1 hypothetical protein KVR01_008065 [Diaporthe batatas]